MGTDMRDMNQYNKEKLYSGEKPLKCDFMGNMGKTSNL